MKAQGKNAGYVAVVVVLMIAAVGILLAATVSLVGVGELQASLSLAKGEDALSLVENCAEDGLSRARLNSNYASGNITMPEGTCSITISKNGGIWTMTASSTATSYQRAVRVIFNRTFNALTITSWQEL